MYLRNSDNALKPAKKVRNIVNRKDELTVFPVTLGFVFSIELSRIIPEGVVLTI